MLISRQGVGGDRAPSHGRHGRERTCPGVVATGGAFSFPGGRCETTFDHPDMIAEIDKEVAS